MPEILEPLVADIVDRCHAHTPYSRVELKHTATRFVIWCVMEAAIEPEPELLFTRRNIERFTQSARGDYSPAARGNMRSRLLRMSEHLLDPDDRAVRLAPLAPATALRPYTRREIAQLTSWADAQGSPVRRRNATILLALGLGTGITARELVEVRTCDISDDGDVMEVTTRGARPRRVPFVSIWAQALRDTQTLTQPADSYLFRNARSSTWPNVISSWLDQGRRAGGTVWLQPQRMRSTWIVGHLSAGTNVRLLVRVAGVDSLEAFTRYLDFVDEPDLETATLQLTGRTAA